MSDDLLDRIAATPRPLTAERRCPNGHETGVHEQPPTSDGTRRFWCALCGRRWSLGAGLDLHSRGSP